MLDERAVERDARENEIVTYWMFKKRRPFDVIRLDKGRSGRRPDFHVFEKSTGKGLVCEVKSIFSAGYIHGRHMSLYGLDPNMDHRAPGVMIDPWPKLWEVLENAQGQYKALVRNCPQFRGSPFVAALFLDFFVDIFDVIPRHLSDYPLISGLIRVERSAEQSRFLEQFTASQLKEIIEGKRSVKMPPPTKKWRLLRNSAAQIRVPKKWFEPCLES